MMCCQKAGGHEWKTASLRSLPVGPQYVTPSFQIGPGPPSIFFHGGTHSGVTGSLHIFICEPPEPGPVPLMTDRRNPNSLGTPRQSSGLGSNPSEARTIFFTLD